MFGDFGNFIQTALGVVAIVSLAGVALQRTNTKTLRERLDDFEKEVAEKDRRDAERVTEIATLKARVTAADVEIKALGKQVRGESYWSAVGVKQDAHDQAARTHWAAEEAKLDEIRDRLPERAP